LGCRSAIELLNKALSAANKKKRNLKKEKESCLKIANTSYILICTECKISLKLDFSKTQNQIIDYQTRPKTR
jgi:hypothetical protein